MDRNTEFDLGELQNSIVSNIERQFRDLREVSCDYETRTKINVPACLIELSEIEPQNDEDPGTEQLAVLLNFEARLIMGFRDRDVKREIRRLAAALATFISGNRWGLPVGPARVVDISPDAFEPDLDRYEIWRIEWRQPAHLGQTVWVNDGTVPQMVLVSDGPGYGAGNEQYYEVLADE